MKQVSWLVVAGLLTAQVGSEIYLVSQARAQRARFEEAQNFRIKEVEDAQAETKLYREQLEYEEKTLRRCGMIVESFAAEYQKLKAQCGGL